MKHAKFPLEATRDGVAIVGKTGSGKSFTARGIVEQQIAAGERVCVIDPTGVWWGLRLARDGKSAGAPAVVLGGARADVALAEHHGEKVGELVAGASSPVVIDLSEFSIGERRRFMTAFLASVYQRNRAPLNFVVDEADEFAPQRPMPDQTVMFSHLDRIVRRGRVRGFRPILITQRPAVLHKDVLSQMGTLVAMRLVASQDRAALKAWIEGQADRDEGKRIIDSLPKLKVGSGWLWAPSIDLLQEMHFPAIATFDSSSTPEHGAANVAAKLPPVDASAWAAQLPAEEPKPKAARGAGVPVADADAIAVARDDGRAEGYAEGYRDGKRESLRDVVSDLRALASRLDAARDDGSDDQPPAPPPVDAPRLAEKRAPESRARPAAVADGITAPQQRILDALAEFESLGVTSCARATVAARADQSSKSSGYANNLGRLRTSGLIDYPAGNMLALTVAGRAAANTPARRLRLADVHASWLRMLPPPRARILEALIASYPKSLTREVLAARVGASPASSGYANNLGAMNTMGAIEYPERGAVRAAAILFPEGVK